MTGKRLARSGWVVATAALAALAFNSISSLPGAGAAGEPADKASVAGDDVQVVSPGAKDPILTEIVKTSSPTDLILEVSLECSIITDVTTSGNETDQAEGGVLIWVSIDGSPYTEHVPVSAQDTTEGRVTFCNRFHQQSVADLNDDDAKIETYLRTKDANAFNWMALNVGAGTHTIRVMATLEGTPECDGTPLTVTGGTCAKALIGNRTLIVEPTKAAHRETVSIN